MFLTQISDTFWNPPKLLASGRPRGNEFPWAKGAFAVWILVGFHFWGQMNVLDKKMSRNPRKWVQLGSLDSARHRKRGLNR